MFCPSCGKDNQETARFCRACGRSLLGLARIDQAESGSPFDRIEYRLDEIIRRHTARYFRRGGSPATSPSLKESWILLGKGYLAVIADFFYIYLMLQFVLEFRLLILLFKSPWQWWFARRARKRAHQANLQDAQISSMPTLQKPVTSPVPLGSVTEQTTEPLSQSSWTEIERNRSGHEAQRKAYKDREDLR